MYRRSEAIILYKSSSIKLTLGVESFGPSYGWFVDHVELEQRTYVAVSACQDVGVDHSSHG